MDRTDLQHLSKEQLIELVLQRKRDLTAAGRYAAIACELAPLHFQGSSSSIFVFG